MVDRTQSLEGEAAVGDVLIKIRGRHYLIPAEAIGSPLEDGGTEILGMLEKELNALGATGDFAMELGESEDDRNARAISARQSRQLTRQARQLSRQARQLTRQARQLNRQTRQLTRQARAIHPQAA